MFVLSCDSKEKQKSRLVISWWSEFLSACSFLLFCGLHISCNVNGVHPACLTFRFTCKPWVWLRFPMKTSNFLGALKQKFLDQSTWNFAQFSTSARSPNVPEMVGFGGWWKSHRLAKQTSVSLFCIFTLPVSLVWFYKPETARLICTQNGSDGAGGRVFYQI